MNKEYLVSFSGGRSSAYMCYICRIKKLNARFVFVDTGAESDETYEFIKKCNEHFKLNLICLKPIISPVKGIGSKYKIIPVSKIGWDLTSFKSLVNKYGSPNHHSPICTNSLKTIVIDKFKTANCPAAIQLIGIRDDERRRLNKKTGFEYLADHSRMTKSEIIRFWNRMPFNLNQSTYMGNCMFCINKSASRLALVARELKDKNQGYKIAAWNNMMRDSKPRKNGFSGDVIYRGGNTLSSAIAIYEDFSTDEIKQKLRPETGCNESCEAIVTDIFSNYNER